MAESNHNFDDFELGDDMDDPWDDDVIFDEDEILEQNTEILEPDTEVDNVSGQKRKSFIKPLVALCILGGGIYAAFPYITSNDTRNPIPVVKIDSSRSIDRDESASINEQAHAELGRPTSKGQEKLVPTKAQSAIIGANTNENVLTPMPESFGDEPIPLPNLIATEDSAEVIPAQQKPSESEIAPFLSEEELLSKTEAVFDEIPDVKETDFALKPPAKKPSLSPTEPKVSIDSTSATKNIVEESVAKKGPDIKPISEKAADNIQKDMEGAVKSAVKKIDSAQKLPEKKKASWSIRAAQSGKAVIYNKNSREMKSVEVNDTIDGIGRIKSIKLIDGKWVINGTLGNITQ